MLVLQERMQEFILNAKKGKTDLSQFEFGKNFLKASIRNFLKELLWFIGLFINKIHFLSHHSKIDEDFFKTLREFINKFSDFLSENKVHLEKEYFDTSDNHIATVNNILKQTKIPNKLFFEVYGITALKLPAHKQKLMFAFDADLAGCFESCMKILALIIYINDNVCEEKIIMDILFKIRFEAFEIVKTKFADKDGNSLIHQIENLKLLKP